MPQLPGVRGGVGTTPDAYDKGGRVGPGFDHANRQGVSLAALINDALQLEVFAWARTGPALRLFMADPRDGEAFYTLPPRPNPRPYVCDWSLALSLRLPLPRNLRDPLQFTEWLP